MPLDDPPSPKAWALSSNEILERLNVTSVSGVSSVDVIKRQQDYGKNTYLSPTSVSLWRTAVAELKEPLQLLLVGLVVLFAIWGSVEESATAAIIIVICVGAEIFHEYKTKKTLEKLSESFVSSTLVIRDSSLTLVSVEEIVVGDVVILKPGVRVPADARLMQSSNLVVEESFLTGESVAVVKHANSILSLDEPGRSRSNFVYSSTNVVRGYGVGVVTHVGSSTEYGQLCKASSTEKRTRQKTKSELKKILHRIAGALTVTALALSVALALVSTFVLGIPLHSSVLVAVSIAFATIPEELVFLIKVILVGCCRRLSARSVLVKRLNDAECLAYVDMLITDKTGTVTESSFEVCHSIPPLITM